MIIECGYCGAPLDVKAEAKAVKCAYCGTSNRVQSTRTVAVQTPPNWHPPPQWTPPAHVPANSAQQLTYKAVRTVATGLIISAVVGVLVVVGVIVAVVVSVTSAATTVAVTSTREIGEAAQGFQDVTRALEDAQKLAQEAQKIADQQGAGQPGTGHSTPGSKNLLNSAGVLEALSAYNVALGGKLAALRLTIHEKHSSVEAQSPKDPTHVDRYRYLGGSVGSGDPVRLSGSQKKNLKAHLFDPSKTALLNLDQLKSTALSQLAYEGARVTHVIAERRKGKTEILVYAKSDRDSGYVRFSDQGKVVRTYR